MRNVGPILTVVAALFLLWYGAAIPAQQALGPGQAQRAGVELSFNELVADTWSQKKPKLPVPHQVGAELWKTTGEMVAKGRAFSKRSLLYHSWVTFSSTCWLCAWHITRDRAGRGDCL